MLIIRVRESGEDIEKVLVVVEKSGGDDYLKEDYESKKPHFW